jgi:hypothetical protein
MSDRRGSGQRRKEEDGWIQNNVREGASDGGDVFSVTFSGAGVIAFSLTKYSEEDDERSLNSGGG